MKSMLLSRILLIIVAYLCYRSRDIYSQLLPPALPPHYFAYGNATTACKMVEDPMTDRFRFCEDVISWEVPHSDPLRSKHLIVSCDPGRKSWNTVMGPLRDSAPRGDLWIYSYPDPEGVPRRFSLDGFPHDATFHPIGIDVVHDELAGTDRLFVINHGHHNTTIEIFTLPNTAALAASLHPKAAYVRTLTHSAFVSPNAITALSPTSFYVTNDHTLTRRLRAPWGIILSVSETFLKYRQGWIDLVEFDEVNGEEVHVTRAASGIPFANGIAIASDGRTVAVASSNEMAVLLYNRDPTTNRLLLRRRVYVPFHPDNVSYDENGAIHVAGHPYFPALIRVAMDKAAQAPSWAVTISPEAFANGTSGRTGEHGPFVDTAAPFPSHARAPIMSSHAVKTLYQSDGTEGYSTSSSAVMDTAQGVMFLVGLYGQGMLQCEMEIE